MNYIDAHVHVWTPDTAHYPLAKGYTKDDMKPPSFTPQELAVVKKSLAELDAFYKGHAKEAKELITVGESRPDESLGVERLAAWTMLVNQLMNLDEVLNK